MVSQLFQRLETIHLLLFYVTKVALVFGFFVFLSVVEIFVSVFRVRLILFLVNIQWHRKSKCLFSPRFIILARE